MGRLKRQIEYVKGFSFKFENVKAGKRFAFKIKTASFSLFLEKNKAPARKVLAGKVSNGITLSRVTLPMTSRKRQKTISHNKLSLFLALFCFVGSNRYCW